jgi:hypothetical protein
VAKRFTINRAGKYVREVVEKTVPDFTGWEHWLVSKQQFRAGDRALFVGFNLFF